MPRSCLNPFMFQNSNYVTLTVNTVPNGATITFNTGKISGNTCTVRAGTVVGYTVTYSGLESVTGSITMIQNITMTVNMHYAGGIVFLDSSSAGTQNIQSRVVDVYCNIICVGGGGGGAGRLLVSIVAAAAGGGSGGYSNADVILPTSITQATVGSAGGSTTSQGGGTSQASGGGTSSVGSLVSATGGGGGYVKAQNSSPTMTGGARGTGTTSNGNAGGTKKITSGSGTANGGASVYNGRGLGASINVYTGSKPSVKTASTTGYVKITSKTLTDYLLTVNVPAGVNLTLTSAGHTQAGNAIRVSPNTDVTYVLSKVGYIPLTNTFRITTDTVLNLDDELVPIPLTVLNCGPLIEVSQIRNAGLIASAVSTTKDAGSIAGTVDITKDAGAIFSFPVSPEVLDMGLVTEAVEETIDCEQI